MRVQTTKRAGTLRITPGAPVSTKLKYVLGIPGLQGEQGEQGTAGSTGPVSIGDSALAFETRAAVAGATIDALVKSIYTSGFATSGDAGHGLYKRMLLAPADPTNPIYVRSVDRYTSAGVTHATNGGYWQLVFEGGAIRVAQLGCIADGAIGAYTGTDNVTALRYGLAVVTHTQLGYPAGPDLKFDVGNYYISDTLELRRGVRLLGSARGHDDGGGGTHLQFAADKTGFIVHYTTTVGQTGGVDNTYLNQTGQGSIFDGLAIHGGGTSITKHGIVMRARATVRNCYIVEFPGIAFYINATVGNGTYNGNANQWRVEDSVSKACVRGGLWIEGSDANAGYSINWETSAGGGCGLLDVSGLGNVHVAPNIAGYGNGGVSHGGKQYQLGTYDTSLGAATTPGTNEAVWYELQTGGATTDFPAWSGAGSYFNKLPIYIGGSSNQSTIDGGYVEQGNVVSDISQSRAVAFNGTMLFTKSSCFIKSEASTRGLIQAQGGIGGYRQYSSGSTAHSEYGGEQYAYVGTFGSNTAGLTILEHYQETPDGGGPQMKWGFQEGSPGASTYCQGGPGSGFPVIFQVTSRVTNKTFSRPFTGVPWKIAFNSYGIMDENSGDTVLHGLRAAAPTSGAAPGEYAAAEVLWNKAPTAGGFAGWICTTTGVLAPAWVTGTNYSTGAYILATNGKYYKLTTDGGGNSTVEPSHGSGVVVGADGYGWTWVSNATAVWKTFGPISA
jgi:hypothetical protein